MSTHDIEFTFSKEIMEVIVAPNLILAIKEFHKRTGKKYVEKMDKIEVIPRQRTRSSSENRPPAPLPGDKEPERVQGRKSIIELTEAELDNLRLIIQVFQSINPDQGEWSPIERESFKSMKEKVGTTDKPGEG